MTDLLIGDNVRAFLEEPRFALAFSVQAGVRYVYAVRAVDKAGNASPPSNRVDETAR